MCLTKISFELAFGPRVAWTVAFFFFFPLYCYVCILSRDNLLYYYQLMQSRLLCLFYTENMFLLKQMRANLRTKILEIVEAMGPSALPDFNSSRVIKPKEGEQLKPLRKSESDAMLIDGKPISYYH